jgi:hypothetical protein
MAAIVRPISLYLGNSKFAEVTSGDYNVTAGNESLIADGGWIGESSGAVTTEITPSIIIPVSGTTVDAVTLILQDKYIKASMLIGGKIHTVDVKANGASFKWDHKSGMCTGDLKLRGGKPQLTG